MRAVSRHHCNLSSPGLRRLAAALFVAAALAAHAEAIEVRPEIPDLAVAPALHIEDGQLHLDLQDALTIALQRNLALVVARHDRAKAGFRLQENLGIYDFVGLADLVALDETAPSASNLTGAEIQTFEEQDWNFALTRLLPSGATVRADFLNARQETNSVFATVNPSYRSDFDLGLSQPLLRNFGRAATERGIAVARTNVDISRETFELEVIATIQRVANAYWNLLETQYQLKVAEESLELARQFHDRSVIQVEVGTLAPLELVQSEAGIATREEEIIRAEALVRAAEDTLRQLLNLEQGELWSLPIAADRESAKDPITVELEEAITAALAKRPELEAERLTIHTLEIDAEYYRNQRLPQLDLQARYGFNGLGGDVTESDFLTGEILNQSQGDYQDALDQIADGDFDGWRVGLTFSYPLQNRAAEAQNAIAELALERERAILRDLELVVETEVRRAARNLDTASKAIASADVSVRLAERNLDAEQKRYDNGLSTSFQVLEIQEDLTEAQSRQVASRAAYQRSLVEYYRAVGSLPEASGVTIVAE
jgi:outer membrane protein TolC